MKCLINWQGLWQSLAGWHTIETSSSQAVLYLFYFLCFYTEYYQPYEGTTYCLRCPAGYFCQKNASTPEICPEHRYCPNGTHSPIPCDLGTFSNDTGGTSQEDCVPCVAGEFELNKLTTVYLCLGRLANRRI